MRFVSVQYFCIKQLGSHNMICSDEPESPFKTCETNRCYLIALADTQSTGIRRIPTKPETIREIERNL